MTRTTDSVTAFVKVARFEAGFWEMAWSEQAT
jgi:thiaminase